MTNAVENAFSFAAAARILGLPESKLRYWSQSGFVGPSLRRNGRQVYSFQDLVGVRAAKELVERGFQPAQIRRALEQVRAKLPALDRPLERLRVTWDGSALALVDEGGTFEVTGQRRFDFELSDLAMRATEVLALSGAPTSADIGAAETADKRAGDDETGLAATSAYAWFARGLEAEASGKDDGLADAETNYRKALALDPGLAAAHTNLGGLAYRRGELGEACAEFDAALALDPEQPEARYNRATILYRRGEVEEAASELRRVVAHNPWFTDAYFNLATALEKLGSRRQAALHLGRYVDLEMQAEAPNDLWLDEAQARLQRLSVENEA
jgi:tetratricopeptide (TPR) repeat protein